ncbi:Asp/Glu/hydantoin racemase [Nakamurella sp. YIM 132087]|uniref:Asp/Glu/hydantoin racemase n=1 Tax=Nakamurella alba TaxID=2665158 RepID=A0A7K1FG22_9ACTN|nr:aspartate/glutamate racemase family protein [Nakamurella alba]MTD13016.1 Asp/Glu/hydantoin racemase [Nakamurella alba]
MRILVVNCNTSAGMTAAIGDVARAAALPGTRVVAVEPSWGVSSAEGFYESFISAAAVLDLLATTEESFDAVVMAGFGEHGREGARQLLDVPVVDITEAAAALAVLVGHRFGVVTTAPTAVAGIEHSLATAGVAGRCAGIRATAIGVLDLHGDLDRTAAALIAGGRELIAAGADALVLGCAGMAGLDLELERALGVPVIDGVAAAVALCESLVRLGKTTSKAGPYTRPDLLKDRPGWPVGLHRPVPVDA